MIPSLSFIDIRIMKQKITIIFIKSLENRFKILLYSFKKLFSKPSWFVSYSRHVEVHINIEISFKVDLWYPNARHLEVDVSFRINDAAHTRLFPHLSRVLLRMLIRQIRIYFLPLSLSPVRWVKRLRSAQHIIFWESLCASSKTEQSDKQYRSSINPSVFCIISGLSLTLGHKSFENKRKSSFWY